jgi:capsular polysaccharide biosynthesis protein
VSYSEDDLDLLPYIQSLIRNWWLILLVAVMFAGVAFGYSVFRKKIYQATASVLMTRTRAALSLAEQFPTINDPIDTRSRMDAITAIANSDAILLKTYEDIQAKNQNINLKISDIKNAVKLSITGDMIDVTASSASPEMAADIANTWAQHAVTAINYAYSGEQLPDEIRLRLEPAQQANEDAQAELETFLEESQISILERQIYEANSTIDILVKDRSWQIAYYVQRKQQMDQVADQAEALQEQLQAGNLSTAARIGMALAILNLQSGAFADTEVNRDMNPISSSSQATDGGNIVINQSQPGIVHNVQVAELFTDSDTTRTYQEDLDKIIVQAEQEKERAEINLLNLVSQTEDVNHSAILAETYQKIQVLQAKLEEEQARLVELSNQRDLARTTYQTLAQKQTEVINNLETSKSVVLASPAIAPSQPVNSALVRNTAIASALGLILGILIILFIQWLNSIKQLSHSLKDEQLKAPAGSNPR